MESTRSALEDALAPHGLRLRGGLRPGAADGVPQLPGGTDAAVLWMVGQVGSAVWPAFAASGFASDGLPDPMDRWSKSIGDALAQALGGMALYPSDGPPWWPFQRWMARCEPLAASPLRLQIHPEFGLWHACRFAVALPVLAPQDEAPLTNAALPGTDVCLQCDGQPCLQTCPVQAYAGSGLDVQACSGHLASPQGGACLQGGCLARRACPVGVQYQYLPAHAAFHMAAFVAARRTAG